MVTKTGKMETTKDNNKNIQDELNEAIKRKQRELQELQLLRKFQESDDNDSIIQSRTDIINLLGRGSVDQAEINIMSQVIRTLESMLPQPSTKQIFQRYRGLIHILQIIDASPNHQISTRKLLETINSGDLHKLIKRAEILGFIKRKKVKNAPGQKGNNMVMNSLTPMGEMLLELSDKYYYSVSDKKQRVSAASKRRQ
jgi:ABC-type uncharacterized transport system permease subunit